MFEVYFLLGSNMGDSKKHLLEAQQQLVVTVGKIKKQSSIYQTQAWGKENQPDFLNQVLLIETPLLPLEILRKILSIEKQMGRVREEKWGSRIIDIDILFYNDEIINALNLTIPHPYLHNRRFTLEPLNEIAKDFVHPIFKLPIHQLLSNLTDNLEVKSIE